MAAHEDSTYTLGKRAGMSQKTVHNVLAGRHKVSVESADKLAGAYGLAGWHLLLPGLPKDLLESKSISNLYNSYLSASKEGREMIDRVADREAEYQAKNTK